MTQKRKTRFTKMPSLDLAERNSRNDDREPLLPVDAIAAIEQKLQSGAEARMVHEHFVTPVVYTMLN